MSGSERRPADLSALVWGTVFVVLGGTYLLEALGVWEVRGAIVVPTLLILAGVIVLATAVTRGRADREARR